MRITILSVLGAVLLSSSSFAQARESHSYDGYNHSHHHGHSHFDGQRHYHRHNHHSGHHHHKDKHWSRSHNLLAAAVVTSLAAAAFSDPWRWKNNHSNAWNNHPHGDRFYNQGLNGRAHYDPYRHHDTHVYVYHPQPRPIVIEAPAQVTTSVQISSTLRHLPANARVIKRNGKMLYEYNDVLYRYDWPTQSYIVVVP